MPPDFTSSFDASFWERHPSHSYQSSDALEGEFRRKRGRYVWEARVQTEARGRQILNVARKYPSFCLLRTPDRTLPTVIFVTKCTR